MHSYMLLNIIENTRKKANMVNENHVILRLPKDELILAFQTMVGLVNSTSNQTKISSWQTSVNLVDMFKSKINFESN